MNISFEGPCTVQQAHNLQTLLLQALQTATEPVVLSFSNVDDADLSFFQLLLACKRSFKAAGKELIFKRDLPKDLIPAAQRTAFKELYENVMPT